MEENLRENELTICTVSFKHKNLIEANIDFVDKMNPRMNIFWIVVENTPEGTSEKLTIGDRKNLKVIQGIANNFQGVASASYHHASGLNAAIKEVKTRYALILDPDFYIVKKDWAGEVLKHMKKNNLTFFGAPYNPKRYMKYRYFPCIHCVFIDLGKISKEKLDFSPQYEQEPLLVNRGIVAAKRRMKAKLLHEFIYKLKQHARFMIKRSAVIGSSRDTGYALYKNYSNDPVLNSECVKPVFRFGFSVMKPWYLASPFNLFFEKFLPDSLCYAPKRINYYTVKKFGDLGYPDVFSKGWDEFVWKGVPFGFHLQGAKKDGTTTDHSEEIPELLRILDLFNKKEKTKTVFISMFEGVESKNILRTGIVDKILKREQEVRVVLFMRNKERAEYYSKEFSNPRIIYEVVESREPFFLERIFSSLKFYFLQTETTDLRAKLISEDRGVAYYYYSRIIHRILARPFFIKVLRFLDLMLVKNRSFDEYFKKYNPNLILLANLFEDLETNFLRAAKRHGVFSVGFINSWDRVTARCILRILPNKIIVFNDTLKKEMIATNNVTGKDIFVSGIPQYDDYFSPVNVSKESFFRNLGIQSDNRLVVYSPIGGTFSDSDWEMMDLLHNLNDKKCFGEKVKILVRFSPNDFIKKEDIEKKPYLLYQYPGTRFSTTRSADWDMTALELKDLKNTLYHMSLIICYASSISIDAVIFDRPVININFEIKDNKKLSKSPTIFYKMTHYNKALKTGGIKLANNENELITLTKKYLENPSIDKEERRKLALQQCNFIDGQSAERIAKFLVDCIPTPLLSE